MEESYGGEGEEDRERLRRVGRGQDRWRKVKEGGRNASKVGDSRHDGASERQGVSPSVRVCGCVCACACVCVQPRTGAPHSALTTNAASVTFTP